MLHVEPNLHDTDCLMETILRRPLALIVGVVFLSGCISIKPGYFADDQKVAEQAVVQFHARLSNEEYEQIYAQTAEALRNTAEKAELISAMKRTHDQFGAFKNTKQTEAKVIMGAPRQVRLLYNTSYEKGEATEEFIWLVNFNDVKLAMYKVLPQSPQPNAK
jgi:outer membrane lipoprotein-sorting protein